MNEMILWINNTCTCIIITILKADASAIMYCNIDIMIFNMHKAHITIILLLLLTNLQRQSFVGKEATTLQHDYDTTCCVSMMAYFCPIHAR